MIGERTDLTYQEFVQLRASALRNLHAAQALEARVLDPRYTLMVPEAAETVKQAVNTAQMLLAHVLDRWARSRYNRSE